LARYFLSRTHALSSEGHFSPNRVARALWLITDH